MRVLLVMRRVLDVGGAQAQMRLLARELRRRGHRVTILTERVAHVRPPPSIQGTPVHAVRSVAVRFLGTFVFMAGLAWYLVRRRSTYDVVQVYFFMEAALAAVIAGALARAPVVVRPACAGPPGDLAGLARQAVWRRLMGVVRHAAAFVALSDDLVEELAEFGCPRARIARISSGVPVPEAVAPAGESPPVAAFVGRLAPQKRPTDLLRAWRIVLNRLPEAQLVFLGDGAQRPELEALARNLDLGPSVMFAGIVGDVAAHLAGVRAFALPSVGEGMSSALLEAMAAGRAVVASRVSGTVELIRDGVNGLLIAPEDVDGLAAALVRLLSDSALATRLGRAAHETVQQRYSAAALADAHLALYRQLTKKTDLITKAQRHKEDGMN
jgi:glycosyltransferase involved in cell wall biosynthesis